MKFTVELEEFYLEEGELTEELKRQIKNDVVSEIRVQIKKQVDEFMDAHVKSVIQEELKTRVQLLMDEHLASGKVKDRYAGKELTVQGWISENFASQQPTITKEIEKRVQAHAKALQDRYDLQFASQIIVKMKDQGFLKEDIAKLLLPEQA